MKKITILITTYNRKYELLRVLDCLYEQGYHEKYKILICDNNSNYDLKSLIEDKYDEEFKSLISVHRWAFNTGLSSNISVSFALVDTDWCLLLSDDDIIMPGAISKICDDIEKNAQAIAIKYSLKGREPYPDGEIKTLEEFVDYYSEKTSKISEMWHLTRVYHMSLLRENCSYFTEYAYTYISFIIPLIFSLRDKKGYIKTSSFSLIEYGICDPGTNWYYNEKYIKTILGIYTFNDIILNVDKKLRSRLMKIVLSYIDMNHAVNCLNKCINKNDKNCIRKKIFYGYCISKPFLKVFPCKMFFMSVSSVDIVRGFLAKMKHKILNNG